MTKLTAIAAAFAAGLTTFAAKAQDVYASLSPEDIYGAHRTGTFTGHNLTNTKIGMTTEEVRHSRKVASAQEKIDEWQRAVSEAVEALTEQRSEQRFSELVEKYADLNGVWPPLAHAIIHIESNYRPNARGKAGEVGLMQIKPATARMMGYVGRATGLFDPETNIKYGMKYLAKAQKLGDGTTCGTILKYNAGHTASRMNPVSLAYCNKVKRHLSPGGANPQVAELSDQ